MSVDVRADGIALLECDRLGIVHVHGPFGGWDELAAFERRRKKRAPRRAFTPVVLRDPKIEDGLSTPNLVRRMRMKPVPRGASRTARAS